MPLAILHMEGLHGTADICAQYNPHYSSIPKTLKGTVSFEFRCFMQIIQMGLDFFTSLNFPSLTCHLSLSLKGHYGHLFCLITFVCSLLLTYLLIASATFTCFFVIGQLLHIFCNFEKMQVQQMTDQSLRNKLGLYDGFYDI